MKLLMRESGPTCRGERPGGCSTLPKSTCSSPWLPAGVGAWKCSRGGVTGPSASPADLVASDAALPMLSVPASSAHYLVHHTVLQTQTFVQKVLQSFSLCVL